MIDIVVTYSSRCLSGPARHNQQFTSHSSLQVYVVGVEHNQQFTSHYSVQVYVVVVEHNQQFTSHSSLQVYVVVVEHNQQFTSHNSIQVYVVSIKALYSLKIYKNRNTMMMLLLLQFMYLLNYMLLNFTS